MQSDQRIKRIAIVGGGTAGWIAASALARKLGRTCSIQLIESPDIPTIGVGEATIPRIVDFIKFLGIDQADFMDRVQSTIKLGIRFDDWHHVGHRYWHPFGPLGVFIDRSPFYHFWHKAQAQGLDVDLGHFNIEIAMAAQNRFIFPGNKLGIAQNLRYALHFDAGLVANYLRAYSEHRGVVRLARNVAGVTQREDGFIESVVFKEGDRLEADLFIDCTGFRGLLIEQTLETGYVDWTPLLPNDRAVAMQVPNQIPRGPYTTATARPAGWQWKIPLQHRVGTGYVYSSEHVSDDAALQDLLSQPGNAEPVTEPRFIKYVTGRRRQFWNKNVVAFGLASGFIEPLESTSIHLACSGVYALLDHFPDAGFDPVNIAHYNKTVIDEYERVRDFIILHYCTTKRDDTDYWKRCQHIDLPEDLAERIEMYRRTGRIFQRRHEVFVELSWFFVMHGMGLVPQSYDPLVDASDWEEVKKVMAAMRQNIAAQVAAAPMHDSFFPEKPRETDPARGWVRRSVGQASA
ncbi:MAG TPA: tryptophan 7-halogenase [Povalibacter sp.]|uniref:tryptophan halogenase family protein n=1 Tax=Povalibacter sp. TaxID=1962978 RepID=UPI002B897496|nr:tryptophan halogenase family protein [Povalibacter sp.]HMN44060.1 tryptophan 7-halogenase [Povalibacter sp.]